MHIPQINSRIIRAKLSCQKTIRQKIIPQKMKETTIKKIIPATMLIAESFTSISGHAQNVNKIATGYSHFEYNKINLFIPHFPRVKNETLPFPIGSANFLPKNKFNKSSNCLQSKYTGSIEELDYFIEKLIPKRNGKKDYNPFYQKAESFIKIGNQYNINPSVLVAIAMQESGRGTSYNAIKHHNIGGIYFNKKHAKFDNIEQCIEKMSQTLQKRIRDNELSIESIAKSGKYCSLAASEEWTKNVMFFLNKM